MRVFFFGNNWLGWQILRWLKLQNETIVGLSVHTPVKSAYRREIINVAGLPATHVFLGGSVRNAEVVSAVRALKPDIGISVLFGHILPASLIQLFPKGCLNLHPALLPYNRGAHPNIWSIVDHTPAGVTLHYIDTGVDTGDIVAQREVPVLPIDTGATLYRKLELTGLKLFAESWPAIRDGQISRQSQNRKLGSTHRVCDVETTHEIDPEATYKAQDLIDLLRARTFPPFPGVCVRQSGRKIYLRLDLSYESDESPK